MAEVLGNSATSDDSAHQDTTLSNGFTATENEKDIPSGPILEDELSEEIRALKKKLQELEAQQPQKDQAKPTTPPPDPDATDEIERFKRMEACLYKHRKEWEVNVGPGQWTIDWYGNHRPGYGWGIDGIHVVSERKYTRPDVFDPTHDCSPKEGEAAAELTGPEAEYNRTIDWGFRRDVLRKNFEWEMDRLFLKEEVQRKKQEQIKNAEAQKKRERRMAEMSAQLNEEGKGDNATPDPAAVASPRSVKPKLSWLDWYSFKNARKAEDQAANIIDILVGEPVIDDDVGTQFWFGYSGRRIKKSAVKSTDPKSFSTDPAVSPNPERIRIRSEVLLRIFADILGSDGRALRETDDMAAVFIRPFKALIYREQALRDWCKALERKFSRPSSGSRKSTAKSLTSEEKDLEHKDEEAAVKSDIEEPTSAVEKPEASEEHMGGESKALDSDSEDEKEDSDDKANDLTKSFLALEHLRCLLKFLDSSIAAKRKYLSSPQCRKVFFSDLWQLFQPGMEVIGSDGRQAYRVIGVTSAKHRVASFWERWRNPDSEHRDDRKPDFSVLCVYIDFDGNNIGPVQKFFDFKRFDGQREITSLEVYPLRFHPSRRSEYSDIEWKELESVPADERYRQKLIRRGAKFLDVVGGKHMYYAGPTLEAKEEVESPVVVDFETTFVMQDAPRRSNQQIGLQYDNDNDIGPDGVARRRVWKPNLSSLVGMDINLGTEVDSCSADCCRGEFVHDDQYVDSKQRGEYIDSILPKPNALDKQPPISVMPRPLKELQVGPEGSLECPDDELVIMSHRVFGFVLRSRKFGKQCAFVKTGGIIY